MYGEGLYRGNTNQLNQFIVDTRDAGNVSQSCLVFSFSVNAAAKTPIFDKFKIKYEKPTYDNFKKMSKLSSAQNAQSD